MPQKSGSTHYDHAPAGDADLLERRQLNKPHILDTVVDLPRTSEFLEHSESQSPIASLVCDDLFTIQLPIVPTTQFSGEHVHRHLPELESAKSPQSPRRVCTNCGETQTRRWRKSKEGAMVCNACGIYERVNGCQRPLRMILRKKFTRNSFSSVSRVTSAVDSPVPLSYRRATTPVATVHSFASSETFGLAGMGSFGYLSASRTHSMASIVSLTPTSAQAAALYHF